MFEKTHIKHVLSFRMGLEGGQWVLSLYGLTFYSNNIIMHYWPNFKT